MTDISVIQWYKEWFNGGPHNTEPTLLSPIFLISMHASIFATSFVALIAMASGVAAGWSKPSKLINEMFMTE